jgi:hypothetical protein
MMRIVIVLVGAGAESPRFSLMRGHASRKAAR